MGKPLTDEEIRAALEKAKRERKTPEKQPPYLMNPKKILPNL